jgi:hypothetical protein
MACFGLGSDGRGRNIVRETKLKSRVLHGVHSLIYRYWVDPLQRRVPAWAEEKNGWRRRLLVASAVWGANLGRLVITDLRVSVRCLKGESWSAVYIGAGYSFEELHHILFPTPPEVKELPRVFLWQVPALARQFALSGELVVCELNHILRWRPKGAYVFTTPRWIRQVLDITRPADDILADMNQNTRRNLRKMTQQGFSYTFTQEPQDFDLFYHKMYRPYIQKRHGRRATQNEYEPLRCQFERGGLILVQQDQEPVCGMLCLTRGDICEAHQMGVHEDHLDQVKKGANVALWWFMMDWARRNNLCRFDFGASRAQTSNGTFNFKRQWGTHVYAMHDVHTEWVFYSENLSPALRDHLNELGFISAIDDRHYQVLLLNPEEQPGEADAAQKQKDAAHCGLDGVLLISPEAKDQKSSYTYKLVAEVG